MTDAIIKIIWIGGKVKIPISDHGMKGFPLPLHKAIL